MTSRFHRNGPIKLFSNKDIRADEKFLVSTVSSNTLFIVSFLWVFIYYFAHYIVSSSNVGSTFCLAMCAQHL